MKLTLRLLLTAAIGLACAWAQKAGSTPAPPAASGGTTTGTSGAGSTGTSPGTTTSPGTSSGITNTQPNSNQVNQLPRPVTMPIPTTISGSVVMDDGSPIPGSVKIDRDCNGQHRTVAHSSSTGDFSYSSGEITEFSDASENGPGFGGGNASESSAGSNVGPSAPRLGASENCELSAEAPGYQSSHVRVGGLGQGSAIGPNGVGMIVLHRLTGDEGSTVSMLSMKAPKDAKKNFDKGNEQVKAKKFSDAAASFQKAVAAYPQYPDAWLNLGRVEMQLNSRDAARADFQKAMDLDKKLLGPWQELGHMSWSESKWEDAARYLDQAIKLDPTNAETEWYSAVSDYNLGRFEAAERSVRTEIKLDQGRNARATFLLGMILIARQDVAGGAEALRSFLKTSPVGAEAEMAQKQLIRVESLAKAPGTEVTPAHFVK